METSLPTNMEQTLRDTFIKYSNSSSTLKEATYLSLKEAILFSQPGDEVTENQIAVILGISRTPVREAMHQLASDGLLEIHHGKKAKILGMTAKDMADIAAILKILHSLSVELCIANAGEEEIRKLEEIVALINFYTERKELSKVAFYNTQFHNYIAVSSKNKWLADITEKLLSYTMIYREYAVSRPGRMDNARQEHMQILDAITRRDSEEAQRIIKDHVETAFDISES